MPDSNLAVLGQYGILGVFALLLVVFARGAYAREVSRSDTCEVENRRLNALIQTIQSQSTAALVEAAAAMRDAGALTLQLIQTVRDLQVERDLLRRGGDGRHP